MSETTEFRDETRAWLQENCPPGARGPGVIPWGSRKVELPADSRIWLENMAVKGWTVPTWPKAYGGAELDSAQYLILLEELQRINARSPLVGRGVNYIGPTILEFGTDEQKARWLPGMARGDGGWCMGYSEPGSGSDLASLSTKAEREGDHYIINGRKIWTSKALESEVCLLLARTDGEPGSFNGLTLFLVDLDPAHCDIAPIPKVGRNAVASCEVAYDDLPVESWRMVGERGRGFHHILHGLNPERILLAGMACGIGEAALRRATNYAIEREVFGRQIGANQAVSHPLAKAHMELNAAMTLMWRAAWMYDNGYECGELANTAKYLAAEASFFAADQAMQTHGGLGYAREYHVERYWREARLQRIAPVSQEMTLNYIAQHVMGLPRSY